MPSSLTLRISLDGECYYPNLQVKGFIKLSTGAQVVISQAFSTLKTLLFPPRWATGQVKLKLKAKGSGQPGVISESYRKDNGLDQL